MCNVCRERSYSGVELKRHKKVERWRKNTRTQKSNVHLNAKSRKLVEILNEKQHCRWIKLFGGCNKCSTKMCKVALLHNKQPTKLVERTHTQSHKDTDVLNTYSYRHAHTLNTHLKGTHTAALKSVCVCVCAVPTFPPAPSLARCK